jgi:hypothetical protein
MAICACILIYNLTSEKPRRYRWRVTGLLLVGSVTIVTVLTYVGARSIRGRRGAAATLSWFEKFNFIYLHSNAQQDLVHIISICCRNMMKRRMMGVHFSFASVCLTSHDETYELATILGTDESSRWMYRSQKLLKKRDSKKRFCYRGDDPGMIRLPSSSLTCTLCLTSSPASFAGKHPTRFDANQQNASKIISISHVVNRWPLHISYADQRQWTRSVPELWMGCKFHFPSLRIHTPPWLSLVKVIAIPFGKSSTNPDNFHQRFTEHLLSEIRRLNGAGPSPRKDPLTSTVWIESRFRSKGSRISSVFTKWEWECWNGTSRGIQGDAVATSSHEQ